MSVAEEIDLFNETMRQFRDADAETIIREFKAKKALKMGENSADSPEKATSKTSEKGRVRAA